MCKRILALALLAGLVSNASGSVWTAGLSFDGIQDDIKDNSVSFAIFDGPAGAADGFLGVGDIVAGILKWNENISDGIDFGDHAVTVFAAVITADNGTVARTYGGTDPGINFSLGTAPGVLEGLLPTLAASAGGSFGAGVIGITASGGGTNPTTVDFPTALGLINGYGLDNTFGIVSSSDYFEADLRDHYNAATGLNGQDGKISISQTINPARADEWANLGALIAIGGESGGFSLLKDFTGPGVGKYLVVPTTTLSGASGPGTGFVDVALSPSTSLQTPTTAQANNGYAFGNQAIASLNPLPEAASLATWGVLASLGGFLAYRRRKVA